MEKKNAPQVRGAYDVQVVTLRDLRVNRNCSIEETAVGTMMSTDRILRFEDGEIIPHVGEAIRLAEFYGCSLQELYKAILRTPKYQDDMAT